MLAFVMFFGLIISEYYFSEKNFNLLKNRKEQTYMDYDKLLEIPILKNNTDNVIHFKTGYENTDEKKFKKSFWDLLSNK